MDHKLTVLSQSMRRRASLSSRRQAVETSTSSHLVNDSITTDTMPLACSRTRRISSVPLLNRGCLCRLFAQLQRRVTQPKKVSASTLIAMLFSASSYTMYADTVDTLVKDEDEVPEIILSDEGREFGKVKACLSTAKTARGTCAAC